MKYSQQNQQLINQAFENQYTRIAKEKFSTESSWATCLNTMLAYGEGIIQIIEEDPAFDPKGGKIFLEQVLVMRTEIQELNLKNLLSIQKVGEFIERFKKLRTLIEVK